MDSDVLIVSYDRGYGNEIPILLVGRNTDKGMEIIKVFEREEANRVYELLSKWNKRFIWLRYVISNIKHYKYVINDN